MSEAITNSYLNEGPSPNPELADAIIERLNLLLDSSSNVREDLEAMFLYRLDVTESTAMHPTIQVRRGRDVSTLGFLGLLNGICGVMDEDAPKPGWGFITAVYDDAGSLVRFERTR